MTITLLADVDCVLNVDYPDWPGSPRRTARIWSPQQQRELTIIWSPAAITRLADLHHRRIIDWVWCTTWCSEAHLLEELWGLPALRRAIPDPVTPNGVEGNRAKLAAVTRQVATGKPTAWMDDSMDVIATRDERDALTAVAGVLLIKPDPVTGFSPRHADELEEFARNCAAAPAGSA